MSFSCTTDSSGRGENSLVLATLNVAPGQAHATYAAHTLGERFGLRALTLKRDGVG